SPSVPSAQRGCGQLQLLTACPSRAVIGTTFPLTFAHRALHGSDASTTRSGHSSADSLVACTVQGRESVIKPFKLGGETSRSCSNWLIAGPRLSRSEDCTG